MRELNCCYVLYLQHLRRKENPEYIVEKYVRELILSIYSLYKFSGFDPKITVFISDQSATLFEGFCNELIDKEVICGKSLVGFSCVPWGTKTLAWCKALSEFEEFLFLDADIKFIQDLPAEKFFDRSMLFCTGNRKHVAKTKKFVRDRLGVSIAKGVGLPITWFNRNGKPEVDYLKLKKSLRANLKIVERYVSKQGPKKGIDDQMIMSAVLGKMGIRPEDVTCPSRTFSATRNIYYRHNHHLTTSRCNINDAVQWLCDKGVAAEKHFVENDNFYYIVNNKKKVKNRKSSKK